MRNALLLLVVLSASASAARADPAIEFLDALCLRGFESTTMPKTESLRFCGCMRGEITPQLSSAQRSVLTSVKVDVDRGRAPNQQQLASSGVRDLVIAAQASCQAAFYPPSAPINVASGDLQLTLRCDAETRAPEAFVSVKNGPLLSQAELDSKDKRMMSGTFRSEYADVTQKIDGNSRKVERWEIDITGKIVAPPSPADLIEALRSATAYEVVVQRGKRRQVATFQLAGKIPVRWLPCGGVGR
jgi:hypothetical protein